MKLPLVNEISNGSRVPKYKQVIDFIIRDISRGNLKYGEKIPSINEVSEECYLSRDTVEKAYNLLKERKIIESVRGKGYYVSKVDINSKVKVLYLLNKLSSYKMRTYNSFIKSLGSNAAVDLRIYHCDENVFLNILEENINNYDYFAIMPHFKNEDLQHIGCTNSILKVMEKIPKEKLLIMDYYLPQILGEYAAIYQDFEQDIYEVLMEGIDQLKNYEKLILVFPKQSVYPYPKEILKGFQKFCFFHSFNFEILDEIYDDMELQPGDAYVIIEETDLVKLVKQSRDKGYKLGEALGIISYNETPLKELLGISVITTDFNLMGDTAAYMIMKNKKEKVKNAFRLINRNSF